MSDENELEIWDHLEDLTARLRRVIYVLLIVMVLVMSLPSDFSRIWQLDFTDYTLLMTDLMQLLQNMLLPEGVTLIAFNWLDSFYIYFVISFAISFVICLPYIAYQLYGFLAPAIYENEKRTLFAFVSLFVVLFLVGMAYAYIVLVPATFTVLYKFVYQTGVMPFYSVKDFFELIAFGLFGSGLFYTFPLVLYLLVKVDLLMVDDLKSLRRHIFVALSFITAIITPDPTPVSMLLMTIPFYILFELTIIILARIMRDKPDKIIAEGTSAAEELLARSNPS
ncbi:twin-arginine translocase subunit TatC [Candidatus Bathyarchaeota archaeon]|nr:twin-arginine translocase subunit TatC [Candidatus Bathyarchaeota archaeon]TFH13884.1 MAG: preprotein translocase subunit TatC [Candidatus Bathyarchaeota archaeon]